MFVLPLRHMGER